MATTEILGAPAQAVEERVLGLVGALIAELGPLPAIVPPVWTTFSIAISASAASSASSSCCASRKPSGCGWPMP